MSKSRLRLEFKRRIGALDPSCLQSQSADLARKMISYFCHKEGVWTLFFPLRGEPDLLCLLEHCGHIQWAFPKVESKEKMNFHRLLSMDLAAVGSGGSEVKTVASTAFSGTSKSAPETTADHIQYGGDSETPMPVSETKATVHGQADANGMDSCEASSADPLALTEQSVPVGEIEGCVVPGLAYDRNGTRLGRGGGYYDRFLSNFKGLKLGVTFDEGLADEILPREVHDQAMHIVVSPKQWIEVTSEVQDGV